MKPSPIPHRREDECYAFARNMVQKLGARPNKIATDNFLAGHVTKPMTLQPFEVRLIARFYWKTFYVEPFGEKTRIALR